MQNPDNSLIWVEISQAALQKNIQLFRELVGKRVMLAPMVKANAYGHGLIESGKIFRGAGVEYLSVNNLFEARKLRVAGDTGKIYIAGYTAFADLAEVVKLDCELVIYNHETLKQLSTIASKLGKIVRLHLKVETGTNRQGVAVAEAVTFAQQIRATSGVELVGVAMHFANIEDTTDHTYAHYQLEEFQKIHAALVAAGFPHLLRHAANSAATLLWDETHFEIARIGIAAYGMWPSEETFVSLGMNRKKKLILTPALIWKTRIAQIKKIPAEAKVGYGCSWQATRPTTLAILPVGYYDGYSRAYFGKAQVLIHGKRASVVGRICMNICMVDITDIPAAQLEDEVVMLGKSGEEEVTAEEMGEWGETINYEVTTRIREGILRKVIA